METEKNTAEVLAVDQKVLTGEVEEWYQNVSLEDAEVFIRSNLQSAVRSVIATGFYLKHIRDNELYLEAGYKNINEYAMDKFGLSASATSRYITRNTKFSKDGNSPFIDDKFKDFSKSQLQEMLGMSDEQLEQVTPDMTVREIRSMARPKEIPYIEIPGQTELKEIPGFMPEERTESFETSTAELFGMEEDAPERDKSVVQPVAGKPVSQEISVAELVEEDEAEIATSQMLLEETAANEQRNEPVDAIQKQQMGHCLYRPEYECSLPEEYMHRPGSGMDCAHECCWDCTKHGECKLECNSSANCPEAEEEIATSQTDTEASENEVKERTDMELLRELLERKKQLLSKCLGASGIDESDEHIRKQKLEVGALASMLCDLEELEEKKNRPKQPELPQLKNNDQRAAFIDAYEAWPLWINNQETGERYYRYDLPDGTSFVIRTYHSMIYDWRNVAASGAHYKEGYGANEEYLLEPGKFFRDCRANRTTLIEKLKEIQKSVIKENGGTK